MMIRNAFSYRSTSKASYLPRQPREKIEPDLDHGSYKLMALNEVTENTITNKLKCDFKPPKSNLPDVLPTNAKCHSPGHPRQHFRYRHDSIEHKGPSQVSSHSTNSLPYYQVSNAAPSSQHHYSQSKLKQYSELPQKPVISTPIIMENPRYTSHSSIEMQKTTIPNPKLYTNEDLIKTYREQKLACMELSKNIQNNFERMQIESDFAVVRKLNLTEVPPQTDAFEKVIEIEMENNSLQNCEENIEDKESLEFLETQNDFVENDLKYIEDNLNNDGFTFCKKLPDELECEKLSREITRQISSSDRLHNILGELNSILYLFIVYFNFHDQL